MNNLIKDASASTADPARALKNLERLLRDAPHLIEEHEERINGIAQLFSCSQFLADYSIKNPESLSLALRQINLRVDRKSLVSEARKAFKVHVGEPADSLRLKAMEFLRRTKKDFLLRITMRDLLGVTSMKECMDELSILAEAVTEVALGLAEFMLRERFGFMRDNTFTVMGLGKLGAGELNYSSDIDILTVYRFGNRSSEGVLTTYGIRTNRIEAHEYFMRLTEILSNLLQSPTEDGIAYRVDLRLRPNGQKGPISLPLDSYRSYYESWGKTWERVALIRSKPVAGDERLGKDFMQTIEPFVWKRSIDYHDIEEIRELKKKIDTIFDVNDIKRGYGGIREIEFFAQTFQLVYGGERTVLRTGIIPEVFAKLLKEGLLHGEDVKILTESYLFLRRLEHVLQMKDDIQTHSLPSTHDELSVLSRKMHFNNAEEFLTDLRLRRLKVRDMYNSLLGGPGESQEALLSLTEELPQDAITDYLSFKGFKNTRGTLRNLQALLEQISMGKTMRERTLLRKTIPSLLEQTVRSVNKDRTLSLLVTFVQKIGNHESYIDLLQQRKDTREIIIRTFSRSTYLTRLLLSLDNLEGIFEYPDIRMDYEAMLERLENALSRAGEPLNAVREFKAAEELKAGILFLKDFLDVYGLSHTLSAIADTIIRSLLHYLGAERGFAVVGLGGLGAEDLNIGSDLDLLFVKSLKIQPSPDEKGIAKELIRFLSEYTEKGFAYKVDMRLRPDGSKGIIANNIEGYEKYYLKSAHLWEIQSLLRARPIAGDAHLLTAFREMQRRLIMTRGAEMKGSDIKNMRERIISEVSKESSGYDVKNGPGGIKEIEFLIQYLQLKYIRKFPDLIIHDTVSAVKRLAKYGILDGISEELLLTSHRFLKSVDTLLRLNEEETVRADSELLDIIMVSLDLRSMDEVIKRIKDTRQKVVQAVERFYY